MEQKFCQNCGMPLAEDIIGTNTDSTKNKDYGIACCNKYILVSEYSKDGTDVELVMLKRR